MNFRPAGYSSDEDDDCNDNFSFYDNNKTSKQREEEAALEYFKKRKELAQTATNRLYNALIHNNLEEIKTILDSGVDVNCEVVNNYTPLLLVASQGSSTIAEELLNRNADPKTNLDGLTALMAACSRIKNKENSLEILTLVQILVKHGAEVKGIDRKRKTALMFASAQGFPEVVQYLLPLSDLEAQDSQGCTALFYAVNENQPDTVKILLDAGANLYHLDIRNNNIHYYARLKDFKEIIALLPEEDNELNPDELCLDDRDLEEIFENLEDNERPDFSTDISLMLYGMNCEHLIPLFQNNDIDLITFLSLNDEKLKDLEVNISCHREKILYNLFRFHKHSWNKQFTPVTFTNEYSNYNTFLAITSAVKHLSVMEGSIKHLANNFNEDEDLNKNGELIASEVSMIMENVRNIENVAKFLHRKAVKHDQIMEHSSDLITKNTRTKNDTLRKIIVTGSVGISITIILLSCLKFVSNK